MMVDYVLLGCFRDDKVLVVVKDRPAWQANMINLLGGKREPGESWDDTAIREFKEETGFDANAVTQMGTILAGDARIAVMQVECNETEPRPRDGETEIPFWETIDEIVKDPRLHENLRAIIPLLRYKITGWTVTMFENEFTVSFGLG